jgi:pyruvate,water dikinase
MTGAPLVLPFRSIGKADLPAVGGKGANLGELTQSGFPVPEGFCVTTEAFRKFLVGAGDTAGIFTKLASVNPEDTESTRRIGEDVRAFLRAAPVPEDVANAVEQAWTETGVEHFYAVRSSATAEDLPSASFAGQQDTYLNIKGRELLLEKVKACWVSLFTDRAITYRARNHFDHERVWLSVIVERMVFPDVSGIMFTADPIDGRRHIVSIDAGFGLGEALVSGLVSADLYKIDKRSKRLVEKKIAKKEVGIFPLPEGGTRQEALSEARQVTPSLSDEQAISLAEVGARIESHYGQPQDIEWCLESSRISIVQSRPITTLYPLPDGADPKARLTLYLSFSHAQVMTDPMGPYALSIWRHLFPFSRDQSGTSPLIQTAGGRLYINPSELLRVKPFGHAAPKILSAVDALMAEAVLDVVQRPEFGYGTGSRLAMARDVVPFLGPIFVKVAWQMWFAAPEGNAERLLAYMDSRIAVAQASVDRAAPGAERYAAALRLIDDVFLDIFPKAIPIVLSGILGQLMLRRLLKGTDVERDVLVFAQGLDGNVTTEMDMALGDLADLARAHPQVATHLKTSDARQAAETVRRVEGGEAFYQALQGFLKRYGMRAASEIDIARVRWSEDPTQLIQMIIGNLAREESGAHRTHHAQLKAQAVLAADRMVAATTPLKRPLVRRLIRVCRQNLAIREHPKFLLIKTLGVMRTVTLECGEMLRREGRLDAKEDVFYLTAEELRDALRGSSVDLRAIVRSKKEELDRFRGLAPPRVMTNEGEIVTRRHSRENLPPNAIQGSAASPGIVEGRAKVVLDPTHAVLNAGEILVAPFTDPGWTPLFINAKGLVMEVGGLMTHGSVVAREYGIPAVVCVPDATKKIRTGQQVRVNGDEGFVEILES